MPVPVQACLGDTTIPAPVAEARLAFDDESSELEVLPGAWEVRARMMWLISFDARSRSPDRPLIVIRSGELPPMSTSRPLTTSPLFRITVGLAPGILAQSASLIELPPRSMTATSLVGI